MNFMLRTGDPLLCAVGSRINLKFVLLLALLIRILFVYLGCIIDTYSLQYTDIDYHVFTDAAEFITQGKSPYERFGYRYPPLIALLLVPGVYYNIPSLGKVIFSIFDVFNVYMMYKIVNSTKVSSGTDNYRRNISLLLALSWALNPLAVNICTRGNADSVTNLVALMLLYLVQVKKNNVVSGILYGFFIYFRIYPIIYALAIALFILRIDHISTFREIFSIPRALICFFHSAIATMLICISLSYSIYGDKYLSDALYHHAQRYDFRHNFSPHFYLIYLNQFTALNGFGALVSHESVGQSIQIILKILPSALLTLLVSITYAKSNLPLTFLLLTMIFVSYNTVCTAQYFMWYTCFVPLVISQRLLKDQRCDLRCNTLCLLTLSWVAALVSWLFHAYKLEILGENTFFSLFIASILFHMANVAIVIYVIITK